MKIIISRTDSIGDVLLTLPMCVWLKQQFPAAKLIFLGRNYTKPVVDCFSVIDSFVDLATFENTPTAHRVEQMRALGADAIIHVFPNKEIASLAKKAQIPMRIGTSHRSFHLLTCTHRLGFTRKKSALHEAQLNFELLRPFGLEEIPSLEAVTAFTEKFSVTPQKMPDSIQHALSQAKKTVILHPKSQGSALEWPIESYLSLTRQLNAEGYSVFFTGTEQEGAQFRAQLPTHPLVIDTTGKLTLDELIYFISQVNHLVACSTGPLHIAGFVGTHAVGLFSSRVPIHPGRWKALGKKVSILVNDPKCPTCKKGKTCNCIQEIPVKAVFEEIQAMR
jgi:heptosyltransferase-3